jgi:hypothetical protein
VRALRVDAQAARPRKISNGGHTRRETATRSLRFALCALRANSAFMPTVCGQQAVQSGPKVDQSGMTVERGVNGRLKAMRTGRGLKRRSDLASMKPLALHERRAA